MARPLPQGRDVLDARHLGAENVSRYLRQHGLQASRKRSQNHLVDGEVLLAIVEEASPSPGRRILEVGPGLGILTGPLLAAGAHVTAVEVDRRLVAHLRQRFADALGDAATADDGAATTAGVAATTDGLAAVPAAPMDPQRAGRLTLVEDDVLDVPIDSLVVPPYDLVANLPYHITSPVLHHALGAGPPPDRFVLMLQREVAERITAAPGGMSYLSVFVQYHADVRLVRVVPPTAFEPAPAVESAVIAGTVRAPRLAPDEEEELWRLVQAGFRERRKMLHNVLSRQLPTVGRARFEDAFRQVGIEPDRRPQTLSLDEWLALAAALGPLGPRPSEPDGDAPAE